MKIVDLRKQMNFLDAYIDLRNQFCKELLANPVKQKETRNWLNTHNVVVLLATEKRQVIGACILHVYRKGEISLFIKQARKGIGTLLLEEIQKIAKNNRLTTVWAFADKLNLPSNSFFQKNGFNIIEENFKKYKGETIEGFIYQKPL